MNRTNRPVCCTQKADSLEMLTVSGAVLSGLVVGDFPGSVERYRKEGFFLKDSIGNGVRETGGLVLPVDKGDAVEKLALLIERLRSRYSFGYAP